MNRAMNCLEVLVGSISSNATGHADSRFYLPAEVFQSLYMAGWGFIALLDHPLSRALRHEDAIAMWVIGLMPIGVLWAFIAWAQMHYDVGRKFTASLVHKFVSIRATLAFLACIGWLSAFASLIVAAPALVVTSLFGLMVWPHVGFCIVSFVANMRVRYALDDRHPAKNLFIRT